MTEKVESSSDRRVSVTEDVIRDELAKRLSLIEPGLTLAGVEYYLPSEKGARGFVDIVARDLAGMFVLVEIKRSTASSRDAIQELLKYLALFVENHGIRRSQMRCLVVSTSWHELSAPFAEVARSEAFQFEGFHLEVGPDGIPTMATQVELEPPIELELAQPYLFKCYELAEQRDAASDALLAFVRSRGDANVLLVYQDYEEGDAAIIYPFAFSLFVASMSASRETDRPGDDDDETTDEDGGPEWDLINSALEEVPWFPSDFQARGAFQFVASLANGWKAVRWLRAGPWEKSQLWSETDLLRLASGFESSNGMYLQFIGIPKNNLDWRRRLEQVASLFEPDAIVQEIALATLRGFASRHPKGTVAFRAYYPEDLLLAACSSVLTADDKFSPEIEIVFVPPASSTEKLRTIRFMLCWDGRTHPSDAAGSVATIYGDLVGYRLASLTHHHFALRDRVLLELGLEWHAFETTGRNEDAQRVTVSGGRLDRYQIERNSIRWLGAFVAANWNWACDLATLVATPKSMAATPIGAETYFGDDSGPSSCERCGRTFATSIYDVSVPPSGLWSCICVHCFNFLGCSLGWGIGQQFTRFSDGKWYLTAGGNPNQDDD